VDRRMTSISVSASGPIAANAFMGPVAVAPMRARHVFGDRGRSMRHRAAWMRRDALAAQEDLDGPGASFDKWAMADHEGRCAGETLGGRLAVGCVGQSLTSSSVGGWAANPLISRRRSALRVATDPTGEHDLKAFRSGDSFRGMAPDAARQWTCVMPRSRDLLNVERVSRKRVSRELQYPAGASRDGAHLPLKVCNSDGCQEP
jgi:hypothetical protein